MNMDTDSVEIFCQKKGAEIAATLLEKYDSADFGVQTDSIEKEIYEVAASYAKIFFFESRSFLSDETRAVERSHVLSQFQLQEKDLAKMTDEALIAHWAKSEAIVSLRKHGYMLL